MDSLVSTDWLERHLDQADVVPVDSSWFMPASGRNAREEFIECHIPRARFLDIDAVSDRSSPSPHMLPSAADFAAAMETLGVGSGDRIVVYDNSPLRSASRGWFTFRHFGAQNVAILNGGLQKWIAEGRRTESGEPQPRRARWTEQQRSDDVVAKSELLANPSQPVFDARGQGRFRGSEPEPRPGLASGHIPGAKNLPFGSLYREDGTFRSIDEIERLFAEAGMATGAPFIGSCGTGVTATSLIFAAHLLGNNATKLYDGSWAEWGSDPATPKELGAA